MDLSRVYIQLIRDKAVSGSDDEKEAILYTLYHTLLGVLQMFSIVCPFITEKIYLNLKEHFELNLESIHAYNWPVFDESKIDADLEKNMDDVLSIVQAALSCRDKLNLGVRWPLSELIVDSSELKNVEGLSNLIMKQVNVKKVTFKPMDVELKVKPNFKTLGKDFGNNTHKIVTLINEHALMISEHIKANKAYVNDGFEITANHVMIEKVCPADYVMADVRNGSVYLNKVMTPSLESEGYAREVMRRVQQLRKDSDLNRKDVIELYIDTELSIDDFDDMIKEKCGARKVMFGHYDMKFDATITAAIKGHEVKIGFNKV